VKNNKYLGAVYIAGMRIVAIHMPNYKTEFASLPIQYQGQVGDNDVIFRARNYRR
jgi:hypothetical protein